MIELARQFDMQVRDDARRRRQRLRAQSVAALSHELGVQTMESDFGQRRPGSTRSRRSCPSSRTTSPTSTRPASSAAARCSRTCCIRTSRSQAGSRRSRPTRRRACTSAPACGWSRRTSIFTQGNLIADEQSARSRDPGPRLLPDPAAGRHARRTRATARSRSTSRVSSSPRAAIQLQPAITIPNGAQSVTIGIDGTCQRAARRVSARRCRSARCSSPTSSIPPACRRAARTCPRDGFERPAADRHAGLNGLGTLDAGLARDLERQRRRGARRT